MAKHRLTHLQATLKTVLVCGVISGADQERQHPQWWMVTSVSGNSGKRGRKWPRERWPVLCFNAKNATKENSQTSLKLLNQSKWLKLSDTLMFCAYRSTNGQVFVCCFVFIWCSLYFGCLYVLSSGIFQTNLTVSIKTKSWIRLARI